MSCTWQLRSMTLRDPRLEGSTIAMNVTPYGFYVSWTSLDPWVRCLCAQHSIQARGTCIVWMHRDNIKIAVQVNKQGGSSLSWRKLGFLYSWQLSLILSGWIPVERLPHPIFELELETPRTPELQATLREYVMKARLPQK